MATVSYTLTGQSRYLRRLTGLYPPVIKRPVHHLADGTALAVIVDENDATAKFGTKNDRVQIHLYQSNVERTTWTLRASYTLPTGTHPVGAASMHCGAALMLDESMFFVWRGYPDSNPPGYRINGLVFTKTGANTWAAPTSIENIFQPADRFPFRFDLDVNPVNGKVFIGYMYRAPDVTTETNGVDIIMRDGPGVYDHLLGDYGIGSTGNVTSLNYGEDFTMAIDPMSTAAYTRLNFLVSGSMTNKDYGDYIGWKSYRHSDQATFSRGWVKTRFNAGQGGGRRQTWMFATGPGEFALIGLHGTTSTRAYATKYRTSSSISSTPTYSNNVPLRYTGGTYKLVQNSLWADRAVAYANGRFAVFLHDGTYFRDVIGRFNVNPANGLGSVVWESGNYTWDSFSGDGITVTDTWRKAPTYAVYGGARNADVQNKFDTLLVRGSRSKPTGYDTAWATQHNRPWKAPNSVGPSNGTTVNTSVPALSAYADLDMPRPRSATIVRWQVASNNIFTNDVKEIETSSGVNVHNTHVNGTQTFMSQKLTQALALTTGTWYIRALQRDYLNTLGAWSSTQQFNVAHPPWASDLAPSGGTIFQYGAGNITFSWSFHDSYEFDAQTAYRVVVELNNEESTTVLDTSKIDSTDHFATLLIPEGAKNQELKWHVQLWDSDDNVGDLSAYANFTVADPPVVSIVYPGPGDVIDNARPVVEWDFTDPLQTGQVAYRVYFLNEGVMVHDSGWRNGLDQVYQPDDIILQNEKSYSMTVQARNGANLESQSTVAFTTQWILPDQPNLSTLFVDTSTYDKVGAGFVRIRWATETADPEFLSWRLYRRYHLRSSASIDDKGWNWELLYEEFSVSPPEGRTQFEFLDYTAPSGYEVHYTLTQAAVRFGSVVESDRPDIADTGRQVSLYSGHYWLIVPDPMGNPEDAIRIENATADSYTEEYETEEMHLVGRGRHYDLGDRLGYAGQISAQLRFIEGSNLPGDPRRQKLDLENLKKRRTEVWIRSPFGDLFMAFTGDIQFERVPGVGSSEFTNITLPYKEVYRRAD